MKAHYYVSKCELKDMVRTHPEIEINVAAAKNYLASDDLTCMIAQQTACEADKTSKMHELAIDALENELNVDLQLDKTRRLASEGNKQNLGNAILKSEKTKIALAEFIIECMKAETSNHLRDIISDLDADMEMAA